MIRLRVEWHDRCPGCGVRLVVDFLDESGDFRSCPWCGCTWESDPRAGARDGLKSYLLRSTREIEETANAQIAVER
jgi:hypothetical protein